jgi:hypothetical protein
MGLLGWNDCLCSMLYYDVAGPKEFYDGAEANTQVSGPVLARPALCKVVCGVSPERISGGDVYYGSRLVRILNYFT